MDRCKSVISLKSKKSRSHPHGNTKNNIPSNDEFESLLETLMMD